MFFILSLLCLSFFRFIKPGTSYFFCFFYFFLPPGTIQPSGILPISNSIANCNQNADYTFSFIPETSIPAGGLLEITFPNQYVSGLGISVLSLTTCSITCSINTRSVTFNFPSKAYNGSGQKLKN